MLSKLTRSFFLALLVLTFLAGAALGQTPARAERIALAAYRNGQWDIYTIAPDGSDPRQITSDLFEETDPAYAPEGTKIAFAARRENNWDIYVLDLNTGSETRLTNSPHYDGAPTWSPDGRWIAYESYQNGNLDIWLIDSRGEAPATNLTVESTAGDFAPAWSPEGETIAFSSWRSDEQAPTAAAKDLYLLEVETGQVTRLTETPMAEEWPAWHPDGRRLALVANDLGDREIFTVALSGASRGNEVPRPVTWLGRTDGPVWSPDGQAIAAVLHRWDGEVIVIQDPAAGPRLPRQITGVITVQGRLSWHGQAIEGGNPAGSLVDPEVVLPYEEQLSHNGDEAVEPYNLVRLNDLEVGTPWLADTVDDSFQAWRFQLRDEVGYDFLRQLSDAARDIATYSDTSQYASWHKSGRAVDTLFDYHLEGQLAHEIVREDYSGETYWRILLRCVDQSGRCGRPVVDNPWNYSSRARTEIAPEQGGIEKSPPAGYYVDMTALARQYGWERISSYDDDDYSWTWHFLAFEYWHYQKRLTTGSRGNGSASNWYQAMRDVYPPDALSDYFTWEIMRAREEDPHLIALKGVPLPLEAKPWWQLVEQ